MLNGIRILDLTQDARALCGRLLADLGAEVVHWTADADAAERLRPWSIGQRLESRSRDDWKTALPQALPDYDVLLHGLTAAEQAPLGLTAAELAERFPTLVSAAMTPFGATGPKAGYAATDLIALAASGHLVLSGAPGLAPVRIRSPQAFGHAAADAAVGVLVALEARAHGMPGQQVDAAAQQSTTLATLSRSLDGAVGQEPATRSAYGVAVGPVQVRNQYPVADGYALLLPGILPPLAAFMARLVQWLHEDGLIDDWVLTQNWGAAGMDLATGALPAAQWQALEAAIERQLAGRTKAELMRIAVDRRLLIAPIAGVDEVLASEHAQARQLVIERDGRKRLAPFARFDPDPLPLAPVAAAADDVAARRRNSPDAGAPLAGLRVLDLFWVVAGPGATRMLADYGATVVHIESSKRLDMVRNVPPYIDGIVEPERAACHHSTNANKLNLSLDLSRPEAQAVLDDLLRWADVVTESFAPGVADRLGFGFEHARAVNPEIIYLSSCLMGQDGPWRDYAGYGNTAAAVSGFHALCGHAGQPPMGCFGPYTDFLSVRVNALAILAAVRQRRRSGRAQRIDMAQAEAALYYLLPECQAVFDGTFDGGLAGNRDAAMVPHGLLPVAGEDAWLALAVRDDNDWQALCDYLGWSQWRVLSTADRRQRESELEAALAQAFAERDGQVLERELQALQIPAHRVLSTAELAQDEQLAHRGHFLPVTHASYSGAAVESSRLLLSGTPARPPTRAPGFAQDNDAVLAGLLSYSPAQIATLNDQGVLT
jgi:crotonobetainyl-CoA:carnitine CoA-transferase CaiB-like acyl-CoA transferase